MKEEKICRVFNDVEGKICLGYSAGDEEEGFHPSEAFIEALKKELKSHKLFGLVKVIERGKKE